MIKELNIKSYESPSALNEVACFLDELEFKKVKTKYTKGDDWTAISFHGYGPDILDILKPGVLKSSVKVDILGPSEMIYSPDKPRPCGARLWIETNSEVVIHNKTTYKDMRK